MTTTSTDQRETLIDGYLRVHRYLEATTEALASATAALAPADRAGAAGLQRAWRRLSAALEHHDRTHQEVVLAFVAEQDPGVAEHLAELRRRHGRLHADARSVTTALGWLVSGWRDRRAGTPEAVGATRRLARGIAEHLAQDEAAVLPRLVTLDAAAAARILEQLDRRHSAAEALPFALATGTVCLGDLPIGLRLAARAVLLPRYERDLAPLTAA